MCNFSSNLNSPGQQHKPTLRMPSLEKVPGLCIVDSPRKFFGELLNDQCCAVVLTDLDTTMKSNGHKHRLLKVFLNKLAAAATSQNRDKPLANTVDDSVISKIMPEFKQIHIHPGELTFIYLAKGPGTIIFGDISTTEGLKLKLMKDRFSQAAQFTDSFYQPQYYQAPEGSLIALKGYNRRADGTLDLASGAFHASPEFPDYIERIGSIIGNKVEGPFLTMLQASDDMQATILEIVNLIVAYSLFAPDSEKIWTLDRDELLSRLLRSTRKPKLTT